MSLVSEHADRAAPVDRAGGADGIDRDGVEYARRQAAERIVACPDKKWACLGNEMADDFTVNLIRQLWVLILASCILAPFTSTASSTRYGYDGTLPPAIGIPGRTPNKTPIGDDIFDWRWMPGKNYSK